MRCFSDRNNTYYYILYNIVFNIFAARVKRHNLFFIILEYIKTRLIKQKY